MTARTAGASWATTSTPIPFATALATGAVSGLVYVGGTEEALPQRRFRGDLDLLGLPGEPASHRRSPGRRLERGSAHPRHLPRRCVREQRRGFDVGAGAGDVGTSVDNVSVASDASGSVVLAGTGAGGIFRSQDRGETWTPPARGCVRPASPRSRSTRRTHRRFGPPAAALTESTPASSDLRMRASPGRSETGRRAIFDVLAIDPEHPSTLYAGGGTFDNGSAVYRSDDGGAQWTRSVFPGSFHVNALALDPRSPERVWAASYEGLFRSDDGARSFSSPPAVAQEVYSHPLRRQTPGHYVRRVVLRRGARLLRLSLWRLHFHEPGQRSELDQELARLRKRGLRDRHRPLSRRRPLRRDVAERLSQRGRRRQLAGSGPGPASE